MIQEAMAAMRYRKLGGTSLQVSLLGFGASPLGDVFARTDPAEGERAVHAAVALGVNFFDVSPYYGTTLAEQRLGSALAGRRDRVILATKCGRYGAALFDFSARTVTAELEKSLARLQTDYIDLLQVHDVEFGDVDRIMHETLPALRRLQDAGKARYIGITGYSLRTLLRIAEAVPVDTVLSYCRYNLLVRDMDRELAPALAGRGIGLINASPLHMGLLGGQAAPAWHPAPGAVRAAAARAQAVCDLHGRSLSQAALRFCLEHPYVASTLVGMATVSEVEQNLRALDGEWDEALVSEITAAVGADLDYVWPSGREENHG